MKTRYRFAGSIVRGWDLQSGNVDVLWAIGFKAVRMVNVRDDLHAIWGRRLHVQRYVQWKYDVVQRGDGEPCRVRGVPWGGLILGR
jgi:hypothetical protein